MKKVNIPFLSEKERENALNEIRIIASVSHPNIIAYKECFYDTDHRVLCVIMEHADGGDLLQKIKYHREVRTFFQEAFVWNVFIQMVQALKALHDNQIVHRDLKSANILLCQDGRVKLADFNVSKIVKNNMTRTQIGTPFYASPEIWNFVPYDYKADMWSLGCIVYEMCCLRTPFQGKDMQQICRRVCRGVYQRIPNIYSKELWTMIQMLLQLAPEVRPSCDRVLQDPFIQNHIRQSQNQTLLFSTISENNCELLSTIQWSRTSASDTAQTNLEINTNVKQQINIDEILSVRLPPPHYTPRSLEPKQYRTLKDSNETYNPSKTQRKILVSRRKMNEKIQSRSVDEPQPNSPPINNLKHPYDQYMNNTIIQDEVDCALPKSKPKLQLRPLNNMAYQSSNRKLQVRTETSQTKRLKIFETPSLVQDSSRNSVEDLIDMPKPRKHRNSVAEKQQPKIYTSFDRQTEQATIQEEDSDSDPKAKNKVQIKHIIDLLQGNPLRSIKVPPVQASKNSQSVPSKGMKNEAASKSFSKQNVDEMKSIKTQMQDINRIIQQSISKREHQYQLLKK